MRERGRGEEEGRGGGCEEDGKRRRRREGKHSLITTQHG